jgi:hypothetical protein
MWNRNIQLDHGIKLVPKGTEIWIRKNKILLVAEQIRVPSTMEKN